MDDYIIEAFKQSYTEDGLTVMAKGIGLNRLVSKYLQLYSSSLEKGKLVFCINATGNEEMFLNYLLLEGVEPENLPKVLTNDTLAQERSDLYLKGGCFIITSRILIVDLLGDKVNPLFISGMLVCNAHHMTEFSTEKFIIRVFKKKNHQGWIKAFSDEPDALLTGMTKVEELLQSMYMRKMYLWPRNHSLVSITLNKTPPEVLEIGVNLNKNMEAIQAALRVAMQSSMDEIRKATPTLDASTFTLENGIFTNFDRSVRIQLDPEWHNLSLRTKQLVQDLTTLRRLMEYLLRYDAVSFYSFLLTLRSASTMLKSPSLWLSTAAADQIYERAKYRVMRVLTAEEHKTNEKKEAAKVAKKRRLNNALSSSHSSSNSNNSNSGNSSSSSSYSGSERLKVTPDSIQVDALRKKLGLDHRLRGTLEVPPKWSLLLSIVEEIREDFKQHSGSGSSSSNSNSNSTTSSSTGSRSGRVLLIVKDRRTSHDMKECLLSGPTSMLKNRYSNFVAKQAALIRARVERRVKVTQSLSDNKSSAKEQLKRATQGRGSSSSSSTSYGRGRGRGRGRGINTETGYGIGLFAQSIPRSAMTASAENATTGSISGGNHQSTDTSIERGDTIMCNSKGNSKDRSSVDDTEALAKELTMMRLSDLKALNLEEQLLVCEDAAIRENQRNDINSTLTEREVQARAQQLQVRADVHLQLMRNAAGGVGGDARGLTRNQPVWQRINNEGTGGGDATAEDALAYAEADMEQVFDRTTSTYGGVAVTSTDRNQSHSSATTTGSRTGTGTDNVDQFGYNAINDGENVQVLPLDPELHLILVTQEELFHSSNLLMDVDPSYVVMYDPDIAVVRALEVYQAMRSTENYREMKKKSNSHRRPISIDITGEDEADVEEKNEKEKQQQQQQLEEEESLLLPMRLYFLTYEASLETHRYVASLSKEKKSFERLIDTKANMVITLPDLESDVAREKHQDLSYTITDTRGFRSGSSRSSSSNGDDDGKVVVDVREFRSSLPSLLHSGGLKILPGTLTVGDYILSPEICVERKGISDLFSSFASGRLYTQIEQMFKYYKYATLLIEFDPNKAFSLQDFNRMSYEISLKSIDAKLTLLALAFPNLKILWSRSPHATSDIFKSLKSSHPEPDLDKAIACGSGGLTISSDDAEASSLARARDDARNILLSLPGVTAANYRSLINPSNGGARDLCELSQMTADQLTKLIGAANAKKLHIFFSQQQT